MSIHPASAASSSVSQTERIAVIDSLRGFAVLGILLMNIPFFALGPAVGNDPTIMNEMGTINYQVFFLVSWIPEGTQRAIFSMLFGAGILLFTSRLERKLTGVSAADFFLRRQLWLLVFGLVNIYILLWPGDILFIYGCCGIIIYTFRNLPAKKLLVAAIVCMLLMVARENRDLYLEKSVIAKAGTAMQTDTSKTKWTPGQQADVAAFKALKQRSTPEARKKRAENAIRNNTGSYGDVYKSRTSAWEEHLLVQHTYFGIWDVLTFMFAGMFLFKTGVITGHASLKMYWLMCIAGLGIGLWLSWHQVRLLRDAGFSEYGILDKTGFEWYTISRVLRTLGIFGTLMLLYRSGWFKWLFALMRPVGQMAFTNYLTQSVICAVIFYGGIGLGLFGHLQRYQIYLVVAGIWVLQIIWSHLWLRFFLFGPLEWCWRSLSYWKAQPMRKRQLVHMGE